MPSSMVIFITVDGGEGNDQVIGLNVAFKPDGKMVRSTELNAGVNCSECQWDIAPTDHRAAN